MYELPSTGNSPTVSTHNTLKMQPGESREDWAVRLRAEWPHDRQPPSNYPTPLSGGGSSSKKRRTQSSQESVPDSNAEEEVIKSSLPCSVDMESGRSPRARPSYLRKHVDKERSALFRTGAHASVQSRRSGIESIEAGKERSAQIRTLNSSIYINQVEIGKIRERKSLYKKDISRLHEMKSQANAEILTLQRAVMRLRAQREKLRNIRPHDL
jgi:hypothetical protein